jgi:hypothetical protein
LPETEPVNHLATTNGPDFVLRLIFQSGRRGSMRDYADGHGALQSDFEHPDPRHLNISGRFAVGAARLGSGSSAREGPVGTG